MATVKNGVDCAAKITKVIAEKLAANGQTFAARYLVPASMEWKRLSPEEAQIISDAGLDILSVFESTASRALSGFNGGAEDAKTCLAEAARVKQPKGTAIYFAVDFDVTKPDQLNSIEQYLKGAASVLGVAYTVGVYGEYDVIEEMARRKAAKHFWQTYAWSQGKLSKQANVYQYRNGQSLAGITVDLNNSFGDEGFWNLRKAAQPKLPFSDISKHWAKDAILEAAEDGVIAGYPDGTFQPDKALSRAEFCVLYTRMKGMK